MSEVRVPDIGDFIDVPVIEIHVSPGDTIAVEDPLVTVESDKATMDIPAPVAGTVTQLRVAILRRPSRMPRAVIATPSCSCSGPGPAATRPPSGPPTWA